jgi:amino acid transporter
MLTFLWTLIALCLAAPVNDGNNALTTLNKNAMVGTELTTASGLIGASAILLGLFLCFS